MKYLIFGYGYMAHKFLHKLGEENAVIDKADIGNISQVREAFEKHEPDVIINCAGKTGKPNIDWCEDHKEDTLYSNVTGPLVLLKVAIENDVRMVHLGSGCVYQGGVEKEYKETDIPDSKFIPSYYSRTKAWSEEMLSYFPVLQVRLRMPLDGEPNPRNLIWKISHYEKVIDVPNSVSVIPDFIDATVQLIEKGSVGIYNVVNPGFLKHSEILDLYKEIVDPEFTYETFSLEELDKITKAGRSNCILATDKLEDEGIKLTPIKDRIRSVMEEYAKNFKKIEAE